MKKSKNELVLMMQEISRDESENGLTDAVRFMKPADYMSMDSLKYFRTEVSRNLFFDWFHNNQVLSDDSFRAIAEVSSPEVNYVPAVIKPANQVWELHRQKFLAEFRVGDEALLCKVYHDVMKLVAQMNHVEFNTSLENLFFELLHKKMRKY